jgi:uncharacterized membrane protein
MTPARGLLVALCIALILFGIIIRFVNLDRKFYTNDEATASLHVAGYTIAEYAAAVYDGRVRTVEELLAFQRAGRGTTSADVIRSLASEDPQHPPLFYLAERAWTERVGSSVAARRALSAAFGTLAIAAIAWLGFELFGSATVALACAALVAVSPFHVLYAQQTREYALWTLSLATASALLLAAMRTGSPFLWAAYSAALALGLYADAFVLETVVAHAIYVAAVRPARAKLLGYAAATLAALLAFGPWLGALWAASRTGTLTNNTFLGAALPAKVFALKWLFNAGAVFFDLDYRWHAAAILVVPLLGLAAAAVVALLRRGALRQWAFVATSGAVATLVLLVPDLLRHESRSTSARYLVPLWVVMELAVGWYVAGWLARPGWRRTAGLAASAGLAAAGVISCAVASDRVTWWGDASVASLVPIYRTLAATPGALVAYRATWTPQGARGERWDFGVVQLADELPPGVRFRQYPKGAAALSLIAPGTTFVLDPTDALVRELAAAGRPLVPSTATKAAAVDAVSALQQETRRARAASGVLDFQASLWRPRRPI